MPDLVAYHLAITNRLLKAYWQSSRRSIWICFKLHKNSLDPDLFCLLHILLMLLFHLLPSRHCNWEGFCFVLFNTKFYQDCLKVPNVFFTGRIRFQTAHRPQEGLLTQGIQMSWVRSKYSASLRKGETTSELGRSSAHEEKRSTPQPSVDDQGKWSAGFWVWEKAAEPSDDGISQAKQLAEYCEDEPDQSVLWKEVWEGQGFISGKNIMRANSIINKSCFSLDLDLNFNVEIKWFFKKEVSLV